MCYDFDIKKWFSAETLRGLAVNERRSRPNYHKQIMCNFLCFIKGAYVDVRNGCTVGLVVVEKCSWFILGKM